jgi:biopolymer transport protein ExbD
MRTPTSHRRSAIAFNMTPMIDISFLLIIFFIVSSHLAQQEVKLELDLPNAASGDEASEEGERRLVVNLLPDGSIMAAGRAIEKRVRTDKAWETTVRLQDGSTQTIKSESQPAWRAGERVRVVDGQILKS